jgi:hypothetical protein
MRVLLLISIKTGPDLHFHLNLVKTNNNKNKNLGKQKSWPCMKQWPRRQWPQLTNEEQWPWQTNKGSPEITLFYYLCRPLCRMGSQPVHMEFFTWGGIVGSPVTLWSWYPQDKVQGKGEVQEERSQRLPFQCSDECRSAHTCGENPKAGHFPITKQWIPQEHLTPSNSVSKHMNLKHLDIQKSTITGRDFNNPPLIVARTNGKSGWRTKL